MTESRVTFGFEIEAKGDTAPLIHQVHGDSIAYINRRMDYDRLLETPKDADAVIATFSTLPIYVTSADCIPVLLYGTTGPIAAVHAGWRGVKNRIVEKVVGIMKENAPNLTAVIGPSIEACCFQVREDLIADFEKEKHDISLFLEQKNGKLFFDLPRYLCETQLEGIPLELSEHRCTFCSSPELPSFRRNKSTDPRIRAWIQRSF